MPGQKKKQSVVDGLLAPLDIVEFCSQVRILKDTTNIAQGHLAIVVHDSGVPSTETVESCLIFFEESNESSMPPIIVKIIPIYSDLKFDIVQSNSPNSKKADLLVTFTVDKDTAKVIFPEKDVMSMFLTQLKSLKAAAESKKLDSQNDHSHEWIKAYSKFGLNKQQHEKPARSNSLPINDDTPASALRYVLPIQRAETIAQINLKRTRTISAVKERGVSLEDAKDHWINDQLMKREDEFVTWEMTTVFVGTWNVHGTAPTPALKTWLQGTLKTDEGVTVQPDFYIIGLQEMETNTEAYIRYDATKENAWVKAIIESLANNGQDYYRVDSKQLVTMLLIVIAKKSHRPFISEVTSTYQGVGLMNMLGNKGGITTRLRFHDSYLCFVTSHLAAFTEKTEKRNQDFAELSKRLIFPHRPDPLTEYVRYSWNDGGDEGVSFVENFGMPRDWNTEASIFHNDFLIWCGDLNYRVNLNEAVIKNYIRRGEFDTLLEYDQLSIERSAGRTFPMFEEGHITFAPTYKYDKGTNRYDTSEKRRAPSWTDRILWKKERLDSNKQSLKLLSYINCMEMMESDHKPVRALIELNVRKIDSRLQKKTRETLVQQLKDNQDEQPRGELKSSYIDFEKVQFMEFKEKTVLLENTGQVITVFKFLPKAESEPILPPWLQVVPLSGVLAPGEKVLLRFEVIVDPTNSAPLNSGEQKMDDILILRLENCKDFFISVSGQYIPTCFGVPLETLTPKVPVPISTDAAKAFEFLRPASPSNSSPPSPTPLISQIDLPAQLWKILTYLWNASMFQIPSLFLEHGDLILSTSIRECLDNGEQFDTNVLLGHPPQKDNDSIAETQSMLSEMTLADEDRESIGANSMIDVLIAFLECLPEPVIPTFLYERALEAGESLDAVNNIKDLLPTLHRNVFIYIGLFLRQAIDKAPTTSKKDREAKITENFTVLLRQPLDFKERNPVVAKEKRERFIYRFLQSLK